MVSSLTAEPVSTTSPRTSLKATAPEFRLLGLRPREARLEVIRRALTDTAGDVKASEHWAAAEVTAQPSPGKPGPAELSPGKLSTAELSPGKPGTAADSTPGAYAGSQPLPREDSRLAEVATAGYRLLDPRRRRTLFERVQLLLWTEDDLDGVTGSLWEVAGSGDESVHAVARPSLTAAPAAPATGTRIQGQRAAGQPASASDASQLGEETQAALDAFRSLRRRDRRATALWISVAALAISLPAAVVLVLALL